MATIKRKGIERLSGNAIVIPHLKTHGNDPFFKRKADEAKEELSRVIFPEWMKKSSDK